MPLGGKAREPKHALAATGHADTHTIDWYARRLSASPGLLRAAGAPGIGYARCAAPS